MEKRWQLFIVSAISVFLVVITIPFVHSQEQETCPKWEHPVTLGGETLFCINDINKSDAIEISIQLIAEDFSSKIKDIKIKQLDQIDRNTRVRWKGKTIALKTDNEVQLLRRNFQKIIKNSIRKYRENRKIFTVYLANEPIFIIPSSIQGQDATGSPLYSREKRAKIISNRIKKIADDLSIDLRDIKFQDGKGGTTNIILGSNIIVTLTDDDFKASEVGLLNKQKLAEVYLTRIEGSINSYRKKKYIYGHFRWLGTLKNNFLEWFDVILFYLIRNIGLILPSIALGTFIFLITWRFIKKTWGIAVRCIPNLLGFLLQFIINLIILILILRAILVIFNVNLETFWSSNLTTTDQGTLLDHIVEVLQIVSYIFLLGITALVLGWLSSNKEGIVISAFEDTTGGKYGANIGKAIADSLVTELVRIREINQLIKVIKETLTSAKDLELPRDLEQRIEFTDVPKLFMLPILDSESSLGGIGITNSAIEVGSIKFTIEPVLLYLRQLWPFGGVSTIVTGSLQTYDSSDGVDTRLVALLNFKDKITSWEVTRPGFEKKIIPEMLKELAFKIAFLVVKSEQNFAPTWERLKDIVETINDYYKYLQNRDLESLHQGNKRCQKLINNERFKRKTGEGNRNFSKLIQDLHWVIGYSYLLEKRYLDAEEVFDLLSRKFNKSSYYNALANTLYSQKNSEKLKLAVEQYGRSIRISQDNISQDNEEKNKPDPYIGLGSVYAVLGEATEALRNYDEAYQCNKELWKSSYNLGKIYLYYLPDTFHPEENKLCHLSEIFGDNVPKKYEIASKIIEKCLHFQQNKGNFYLHSALGLAYLFQSVYSVTDNKKKKKYLNLAQTNAEKAAYLGGEVDFIFWNLGLTRLGSLMIENDQNKCKSIIEGAFSAWKIALIIDQKERRKLQQKDRERDEQLKVLIYENMIKIFSGKNLCSREINYLLQRKGLDEPYLRTRRKVLEKDLDVICEILKKNRFNH